MSRTLQQEGHTVRRPRAAVPSARPQTTVEPGRPRVWVLGRPGIDNVAALARPVRLAALELMVYLALHPHGAGAAQLTTDLFGGTSRRAPTTRQRAAATHLRRLLAGAVGGDPADYVVERRDRLHFAVEPDVDVDLWRAREHMFRAARALDRPTKVAELRLACGLCVGPLADGTEYGWIGPHREVVRRQIVGAHADLAALVLDSDPAEAARLLEVAAAHDPVDADLRQRAVHARRLACGGDEADGRRRTPDRR